MLEAEEEVRTEEPGALGEFGLKQLLFGGLLAVGLPLTFFFLMHLR